MVGKSSERGLRRAAILLLLRGVLFDLDEIPNVIELVVDLERPEPEVMTIEVLRRRFRVEDRQPKILTLKRRVRVAREIERGVVRDQIVEIRLAQFGWKVEVLVLFFELLDKGRDVRRDD